MEQFDKVGLEGVKYKPISSTSKVGSWTSRLAKCSSRVVDLGSLKPTPLLSGLV